MRGSVLCGSLLVVISFFGVHGGAGTTPDLEEIFIGRCHDYNLTISPVASDCDKLWMYFQDAFANKPPCGLNYKRYFPFLRVAAQDVPTNESLFWSGTYDLVHRLSNEGENFFTLEDTLYGYLGNELIWCGMMKAPGINYQKCPKWGACNDSSSAGFWKASSQFFAQEAEGEVFVLLSGSSAEYPAYRKDSTFASVELPNLNATRVLSVNVLLSYELGKPKLETCTTGTLVDMRKDVLARGLEFTCQENPDAVRYLQCSDDPTNPECENEFDRPNIETTTIDAKGGSAGIQHGGYYNLLVFPLLALFSRINY